MAHQLGVIRKGELLLSVPKTTKDVEAGFLLVKVKILARSPLAKFHNLSGGRESIKKGCN